MPGVSIPPAVTASDVQALIDQKVPTAVTQYVNNGTALTVATLMTNFPASNTTYGMYARVSNLYGSVDDIMRCRFDGTNYRWVPQREAFNGNIATSGAVSLIPLITPPTVTTGGSLTGSVTITPSSANAYLGQRFRVVIPGTVGVYTALITGLVGSNLTLLGNSAKDIEYGSSGWFSAT